MKTCLLRDPKAVEPQKPVRAPRNLEGCQEGSRGLSAAIPPDRGANGSAPWKGARLRRGRSSRLSASGTPAGVQRILQHRIRGCRCAQPPATFWQPAGLRWGHPFNGQPVAGNGGFMAVEHRTPLARRDGAGTFGATRHQSMRAGRSFVLIREIRVQHGLLGSTRISRIFTKEQPR